MSLVSCYGGNWKYFGKSNSEIADSTFNQIIEAINTKDHSKIITLFSDKIQEEEKDLEEKSIEFINFIIGDVVSYTSTSEGGMVERKEAEYGRTKTKIEANITLNTTSDVYHIAIKECIKNDFDISEVGVFSICIINDVDWNSDYDYWGGQNLNIAGIFIDN